MGTCMYQSTRLEQHPPKLKSATAQPVCSLLHAQGIKCP